MTIIQLIVILVLIGVIMWVINSYIPMADNIKKILNIAVVIAVVLWLLQVFGIFTGFGNIRVGH